MSRKKIRDFLIKKKKTIICNILKFSINCKHIFVLTTEKKFTKSFSYSFNHITYFMSNVTCLSNTS